MKTPALIGFTPLLLLAATAPALGAAPACEARTGERIVPVVELYTSEGCSSCPPADRWLSRIARDPSVVALAFHVNYWDHLGWRDRFATPEFTRRQAEQRSVNGAPYNYTPQVVVQGIDRRDWSIRAPALDLPGRPVVDIAIAHEDDGLRATVTPRPGAPLRFAAYWALTEDGHRSAVGAGENRGESLAHDAVVRELRPVPAWQGTASLRYKPSLPATTGHPRAVSLVVTDAATGRPLQALRSGC